MTQKVRVFAPATVANVACGFDILGFALEYPGDELCAALTTTPGVTISKIEGAKLPFDPVRNSAGAAAIALLKHLNAKEGVNIELYKKMPLGSGLGSSAASAVAAVFAINKLFGYPLSEEELIPFAMEGERAACGAAHADNVAPALIGGFVLVRSYSPLDVQRIPTSLPLFCAVLHPKIEISTAEARLMLPPRITLQEHVRQSGNVAGLVLGLTQSDVELISRSLEDIIAEPIRSKLIPGFDKIKEAALEAGALGCSISGSGPSLFALATTSSQAKEIGKEMQRACRETGVESDLYLSGINPKGVTLLP